MGGLLGKNNIERGLLIKYRRRDGVLGKSALSSSSLPRPKQGRGRQGAGGSDSRRPGARRRAGLGGKERRK